MTRVFARKLMGSMLAIPILLGGASALRAQEWALGPAPLYMPYDDDDVQPHWRSQPRHRARYQGVRQARPAPPQHGYAATRQTVSNPTGQPAGTVVVDTRSKYLYLTLANGRAVRYGIGVGRDGFRWRGSTRIGRKAPWPSWRPPAAMRRRQPHLPTYMAGGIRNPLGARALYLYTGGKDTMFRIHGTNERWSIGRNVSSGCIRMLNEDVIDLYSRVRVGTRVVVR